MLCRLPFLLLLTGFFPASSPAAEDENPKPVSPVVVELFTSQGCSSCPPADRLLVGLHEISEKHQLPIYCLSFHVDYWNSLGWRDPYSSKLATERQRRYAAAFETGKVYTPQMIVGGETEFVGSRAKEAQQAIESALAAQAKVTLAVDAKLSEDNREAIIEFKLSKVPPTALLNVALVQRAAKNSIPRGENSGRELAHVQVVRAFETVPLKSDSGKIELTLPKALASTPSEALGIIAYVQDPRTMEILGASKAAF